MKVTSVNNRIAEREGYRMLGSYLNQGFFIIDYAAAADDKGHIALSVYFNQDGKEVFTVEHDNAN